MNHSIRRHNLSRAGGKCAAWAKRKASTTKKLSRKSTVETTEVLYDIESMPRGKGHLAGQLKTLKRGEAVHLNSGEAVVGEDGYGEGEIDSEDDGGIEFTTETDFSAIPEHLLRDEEGDDFDDMLDSLPLDDEGDIGPEATSRDPDIAALAEQWAQQLEGAQGAAPQQQRAAPKDPRLEAAVEEEIERLEAARIGSEEASDIDAFSDSESEYDSDDADAPEAAAWEDDESLWGMEALSSEEEAEALREAASASASTSTAAAAASGAIAAVFDKSETAAPQLSPAEERQVRKLARNAVKAEQQRKKKEALFDGLPLPKQREYTKLLDESEKRMATSQKEKTVEVSKRLLHHKLRIIAGTIRGKRLWAPQDKGTRPMMQKVRAALFSMLLAYVAGTSRFPDGLRWLDLFAGTGAIGLEGLSRGCSQAHFVELDDFMVKKCLTRNLSETGFTDQAIVHQDRVEKFLKRSLNNDMFAGGPFDFITVCPPYLQVSYPELYDLLDKSPLVDDKSLVVVEYSAQNIKDIRDSIGPLSLVKQKRYGRTNLAMYA